MCLTALKIRFIYLQFLCAYCIFLKVTAGVPLPKEYIDEVSNALNYHICRSSSFVV